MRPDEGRDVLDRGRRASAEDSAGGTGPIAAFDDVPRPGSPSRFLESTVPFKGGFPCICVLPTTGCRLGGGFRGRLLRLSR
jgi:hypothetical protein